MYDHLSSSKKLKEFEQEYKDRKERVKKIFTNLKKQHSIKNQEMYHSIINDVSFSPAIRKFK